MRDADIIVLNKTDLVTCERLPELRRWLSETAPQARIVSAVESKVPPATVLESFLGRGRVAGKFHEANMFQAVSLELDGPVDVESMARNLAEEESGLVRAKGFAMAADGICRTIQIVGRRWTVSDAQSDARCGIVCIGMKPHFDPEALKKILADAAA